MTDPTQMRCQVIGSMSREENLQLQLTILVELARRLDHPELDIDTYWEEHLLPELLSKNPLTPGTESDTMGE